MKILSGKIIKEELLAELKIEIQDLISKKIIPKLAVILVGDDGPSSVYVKNKIKTCEIIGIESLNYKLDANLGQTKLLNLITELNNDPTVHGILCQLPLPPNYNEENIIKSINPLKDVDCFHPFNLGLLIAGTPRFIPCTPAGILEILKRSKISTSGKKVAIIGRGPTVGRPLSILMSSKEYNCTVTLCHSKTQDIKLITKQADIIITAIGKAKFLNNDFIKKGAVLIDVGINSITHPDKPGKRKLVGDIDFDSIKESAYACTPVPGGVGPMTISMLMQNTVKAAKIQHEIL